MKILLAIIPLTVILISNGQTGTNLEKKHTLKKDSITKIYLSSYCGPLDTCIKSAYRDYLLNASMTENLINKLNESRLPDTCTFHEYSTEYQLFVHLNNSTYRYFQIVGDFVIEKGGQCYNIHDSVYFKNLWTELDDKWIELNNN